MGGAMPTNGFKGADDETERADEWVATCLQIG